MKTEKLSLVAIQRNLLKTIFSQDENTWKVLILDPPNREISSSIFKMKDLREKNITLYFNLKEQREQLHGVTAIYLIQPIIQNIEILTADIHKDLYNSVIVHFSSEPSAHLLSTFAKGLTQKNSKVLSKIKKVQYSTIGFQCIDNRMAILPDNSAFINIICSLKSKPIFVYSPNDKEKVYHLKERIDPILASSEQMKQTHTLVIFLNRELDLFPMFSHGITYSSLIENIFHVHPSGHRITAGKVITELDLSDQIWLERKNLTTQEMELTKDFNLLKTKLQSPNHKVEEITELTEKNKKIQWHLNNIEILIKEAFARRLNQYHQIENQIYSKKLLGKQAKKGMISLLDDPSSFMQDKIRIMLIYLLAIPQLNTKELQELEGHCEQVKKNSYYNSVKLKKMKNEDTSKGSSKYLRNLAKGIWSNLVSVEKKFILTNVVEKILERQLSQNILREFDLQILGQPPKAIKVENIIVYIAGGVCFNQAADLARFDPTIIYTGDKFIAARDYIGTP